MSDPADAGSTVETDVERPPTVPEFPTDEPTVAEATDWITVLFRAVMAGDWQQDVVAAVVMLLVLLIRWQGKKRIAWLATNRGGIVVLAVVSFGGALVHAAFAADAPVWDGSVLRTAFVVMAKAALDYAVAKKLLFGGESDG